MARMFPFAIREFKNEVEEQLYKLFKQNLDDDYYVMYGRAWPRSSNSGNTDIECDFIIAKENSGILVLEVKGGRWERRDGQWFVYDKPANLKDDPFEQARNNKYALVELLKRSQNWSNTWFPVDYAVALPDTEFPQKTNLRDLPPVLTYSDLHSVFAWMEEAMQWCLQRNNPATTTNQMIDHLLGLLMRDYRMRLSDILSIDEHKLLTFTEEQLKLDRSFQRRKRLTVQGCAGSGKTLMAIKQVKRLATLPHVERILFTCFNRELAGWLKQQTAAYASKCDTLTFHALCRRRAIEAGLLSDNTNLDDTQLDELPYLLLEAIEKSPFRYDAIVVDEGQSFDNDWWTALQYLLADDQNSYFYVFYDEFQRIYHEGHNFVPGENEAFDLTVNVRNTAAIHRQATKFLPKDRIPDCNNVLGMPVEIGYYNDERSMKNLIRQTLHSLIREGGVSSKDIIILTPKGKNSSLHNESVGPYQLGPLETTDPASVRFTAIQGFRGMERQAVIVTEMDDTLKDLESFHYLGTSRAKTKLVMLLSEKLDVKKKVQLSEGCIQLGM